MYKKGVVVLVMGALLTVILAACTIENGVSASSGPTVHMGVANFLQSSITIKKGEAVNLVDDATSEHIIVNGSWVGSTPHNAKEAGAPTVQQVYHGNDNAPIGPFNTAGTFHVYCTIHQGMNLTVIVH